MVSCSSVTNTKAAWGNSAVHTYTDASGQKGRGDAYANAQNDAQTQAKGACAGLTVGPCNAGCGTVSVSGPTFAPAQEGAQCGEQLVSIGVHAVTCRVTGTCTMTRACSVNL